jgi:acyl-CoA reductase-like NAD-dependent aldehyde dehydrogenase
MLVFQPYDRAAISDVALDDAASIQLKLENASTVFADQKKWLPSYIRIEILKCLSHLVEEEREQFALLIAQEGGKPLADARIEVTRAVNGIEIAAASIERLAGEEIPMGLTAASTGRMAFTTREPIGVVVAISAFNHPLNLIVHQVVPGIAAGCPVIVKPASTTPLSCLRFVELVHDAGLPEMWCQTVVVEDNELAEALATDSKVAFVSFIGSARVGWLLRSKLAPGTRFSLEHGGAAPVLVDRSAEMDALVDALVKGAYYHAGQVCVSVQRIFVHEAVKQDFIERFAERVSKLRVGDPASADTEVGPLILPREVDRVESWVQEAIKSGGKSVAGGSRLGATMFQPTVIVEPHATARLSKEEVFGPVSCVYGFSELSDAVSRANDLPFAFQASVFTRDIDVALNAAKLFDASAVLINDHTAFRVDWMPFAGRRQSGYGTGGILYTMRDMTQEKMIAFKFQPSR